MAGKKMGIKSKKHENIRLITEAKLNSIVDLISRAVENGEIDKYEFSLIMQEKQKYMVLKEQMRQKNFSLYSMPAVSRVPTRV